MHGGRTSAPRNEVLRPQVNLPAETHALGDEIRYLRVFFNVKRSQESSPEASSEGSSISELDHCPYNRALVALQNQLLCFVSVPDRVVPSRKKKLHSPYYPFEAARQLENNGESGGKGLLSIIYTIISTMSSPKSMHSTILNALLYPFNISEPTINTGFYSHP